METNHDIQILAAAVSAASTVAIAVFSFFVWRINKRLAWLTGAMESHSQVQYLIAARDAGIEVVWWDPTIKGAPVNARHGADGGINRIYRYVPPDLRKGKKSLPPEIVGED